MFALEITFQDGVSQPEMIFVRRPQALVGGSDYAHVAIEDMKDLPYQIRIIRDLGRGFHCRASGKNDQPASIPEGPHRGELSLDMGTVRLSITALDFDLLLKESEPPDRAGVRVLRRACSAPGPLFPAMVVKGSPAMVVSFTPEQPVFLGRSKQCPLRLDSADISAKHARMGFEHGRFWIEDLGSTNGTYVNQQQISGRIDIASGVPVVLGREVTIVGVTSPEELAQATYIAAEVPVVMAAAKSYPVLVSLSEVARPARLAPAPEATLTIGRDPACDMWLGAPHVSRHHCSATLTTGGSVCITDMSTNGTAYDGGALTKGQSLDVQREPRVLDFGNGVTVAICFDEKQENLFKENQGAIWSFNGAPAAATNRRERSRLTRQIMPADRESMASAMVMPGRTKQNASLFVYFRQLGAMEKFLAIVTLFILAIVITILGNVMLGIVM